MLNRQAFSWPAHPTEIYAIETVSGDVRCAIDYTEAREGPRRQRRCRSVEYRDQVPGVKQPIHVLSRRLGGDHRWQLAVPTTGIRCGENFFFLAIKETCRWSVKSDFARDELPKMFSLSHICRRRRRHRHHHHHHQHHLVVVVFVVLLLLLLLIARIWHKGAYTKVKVHTLDIAPIRSESPPQKRSGMTRVLKGFHSFTGTPTCSSAIGMSHTCLCLPSRSWYPFTDPEGWKAE